MDKLYSHGGFKSEGDRVEHLFALYESQAILMLAKPKNDGDDLRVTRANSVRLVRVDYTGLFTHFPLAKIRTCP